MLNRLAILFCNLLWLVSCLPGWMAFAWAVRSPQWAQARIWRRWRHRNAETAQGRRLGVAACASEAEWRQRMPIQDYAAHAADIAATARGIPKQLTTEPVRLLEPTSGSTGGSKLIPYTASLQAEFRRAINPWIADLFLRHPRLLLGRHYWSVSPATPPPAGPDGCTVPVGFTSDAEYLGVLQRGLRRILFAVPCELRQVTDPAAHAWLTLRLLLADRRLGLVSVWHPSFLLILLETAVQQRESLVESLRTGKLPKDILDTPGACLGVPREHEDTRQWGHRRSQDGTLAARLHADPRRAAEVDAALTAGPDGFQKLWPALAVISCWDQARAAGDAARLRQLFPDVFVQGKGLLATEGVVTIPWGGRHLCAVRSHYLEFVECEQRTVHPLAELVPGHDYEPLLTTSGGLCRYQLGDRVRCLSADPTPSLAFVARTGVVCDLHGEKLHGEHVEAVLHEVEAEQPFLFAMLAPELDAAGYVLFVEDTAARNPEELGRRVEAGLCANYHYAHARRLGQLRQLRVQPVRDGMRTYREAQVRLGRCQGAVKPPALSLHPSSQMLTASLYFQS